MNDSILDQIFEDSGREVARPSDEALGVVAALAQQQLDLEEEIKRLNDQLEQAQDRLNQVRTKDLPDSMKAIGMSSFKLVDGSEVSVRVEYNAHIKEENRPAAHAWLRGNSFGDLIKNQVSLAFGRGEDAKAAKVVAWLAKQKLAYEQKESVHPMTLKAFVREQLEGGRDVPTDLLGVHVVDVTKITRPKERKKG